MATYTLAPNVKRQFLDNSGNPLSSGKIYTVAAGGSYPANAATVYQTSSGTAHTNPIVLDSAGRVSGSSEIYLEPGLSYKFIAAASSSDYTSPLWTQDNISAVPPSSVNVDIQGTFGENVTAGDLVYLGAAGSWLKSDADDPVTSAIPDLGFAVTTTASGSSGTIRTAGQITLTGLAPGSVYYPSSTAGSITTVAPAIMRTVGTAQSTTVFEIAIQRWSRPTVTPQGRLSLTTDVPVTTADVTAATTLYYVPYVGTQLPLYDTTLSKWYAVSTTQISIAVPATTNQMYDVFVYNNAGTITLELTAWTNDTTRATALAYQDGLLAKTGALTRLYLGSFRTTGVSGQTEDSFAKRLVYNYYNPLPREGRVLEATNSWTYTTATYQQANASTANQLAVVNGVAERPIDVEVIAHLSNDTAGGFFGASVSIGEDSATTAVTGVTGMSVGTAVAGRIIQVIAKLRKYPAAGYHFYTWLEQSAVSNTTTWYGDNNAPTTLQSGISGRFLQ